MDLSLFVFLSSSERKTATKKQKNSWNASDAPSMDPTLLRLYPQSKRKTLGTLSSNNSAGNTGDFCGAPNAVSKALFTIVTQLVKQESQVQF